MRSKSDSGIVGAVLIGAGVGLTATGLVLVIPACMSWSAGILGQAARSGRKRVETAASSLGEFAGRAQSKFDEAAKSARHSTSRAAGAVETAARHVKEYAS